MCVCEIIVNYRAKDRARSYDDSAAAFVRHPYRRCHGKQTAAMNEHTSEGVYLSCWNISYNSPVNEENAVTFFIYLYEICERNLYINVELCTRSHLPYSMQWRLWTHSLGVHITAKPIDVDSNILSYPTPSFLFQFRDVIIQSVCGKWLLSVNLIEIRSVFLWSKRNIFDTGLSEAKTMPSLQHI